jgi:DNA-binding NarL/FixJ family response regulator
VQPQGRTRHAVRQPLPNNRTEPVRVLLASDDPFSREAFRSATRAPNLELVAATSIRVAAEQLAAEVQPDVVVLDAQGPAVDALLALRRIRRAVPDARVLVFSSPESLEFGWLCLSLGAAGYLSKDIELESMPRILERLHSGEAVFSRRMATQLVERLRIHEPAGRLAPAPITTPERQVLELIQSGNSLEQAAQELGVTIATLRRHLASARRKLAAPLAPLSGNTTGFTPGSSSLRAEPVRV